MCFIGILCLKNRIKLFAKHKQGNMERLLGGAIAELGRKLGDCFAVEVMWTCFHYSHWSVQTGRPCFTLL